MAIKTNIFSEYVIDARLRLDGRRDQSAFCRYFSSEQELPSGFYCRQDKVRDGLKHELDSQFENGPDWDLFFIPAELLISERILIEISSQILDDNLISIISSYITKEAPEYCVIVAVYDSLENGSIYFGRFIITINQIVVEESLVECWLKKIKGTIAHKP